MEQAQQMLERLTSAGVRAKLDDSDRSPGWKYNFWEMKGVPVRLEVGPRDVEKGACMMARRDRPGKEGKEPISVAGESFVGAVQLCLQAVQVCPCLYTFEDVVCRRSGYL
jgi:prolyl-tRNA synthetase